MCDDTQLRYVDVQIKCVKCIQPNKSASKSQTFEMRVRQAALRDMEMVKKWKNLSESDAKWNARHR